MMRLNGERYMKLESVAKILGGDAEGFGDTEIEGLCTDSSGIKRGDLFFCYRGEKFDSHSCALQVKEGGAAALVCERKLDCDIPQIVVKDGRAAVAAVAREFYGEPDRQLKIVGVTGTNGKTTTVSMIHEIFKAAGKNSVLCGNVGNPLVGEVEKLGFDDIAVVEVSSFQLETLSSLRPHAAVITNITEDHLNRHYNMENYIFLKSKILRNLRGSEYAVLNADDAIVRPLAEKIRCRVIFFSMEPRSDGVWCENGAVYCDGERLFSVSDMKTEGAHNVYNALAAIAAAKAFGIDLKVAAQAVCAFKGVRHRIETVCERGGKTYIDDSKGTNVDAAVKAIDSMRRETVILLGGKDKGYEYYPLFKKLKDSRVVHAVLYGENRFRLLAAAEEAGYNSFSLCSDFEMAVKIADHVAHAGQNVLLSPASSSFDEFSGYEERGDAFARLVKSDETA